MGRVYLLASLNVLTTLTFAQTPVVKGSKTDNNYANTTEINKTKGASDAQVLAELEGDYGIGDVVRIVITTPKPVTDPLLNSGSGRASSVKMSRPTIPSMPPIGNLPAPQQGTTPPQYNLENTDNPTVNRPNNVSFTPIANRPAPQQAIPQYYDATGRRISGVPIVSKPTQFYDAQGRPVMVMPNGSQPNNSNTFTPIANRPAPQQPTTPPQYFDAMGRQIAGIPMVTKPTQFYDAKGRPVIVMPNSNQPNNSGQMSPIANRPAPQQQTTPPQYNNPNPAVTATPNTPIISSKAPQPSDNFTASTSGKIDLTNAFQKDEVAKNETVTSSTNNSSMEKTERTERTERSSSRSEHTSSGSSARASKSSGFSFKNIFSGFGGSGTKMTKRRNVSSHKKYGCYRFN